MKLNCKGFVLLETMIVAVFVVGIFTFLYSSVVPLLGTYEDSIVKSNVDVVYKLYHLKEYLHTDSNFNKVVTNNYGSITCNKFSDKTYCNNLINFLDLDNGYELVYVENITSDKQNIVNLAKSEHLKKYINNFDDDYKSVLFLYDNNTEAVTHLYLNRLMCDDSKLSCNIINTLPLTKADVDGTRYVTGATVKNNYVWYSGKMWRIVALNDDGTVKLVTQNAMTSVGWATSSNTDTDYSTSQIRSWLNTEFLPTINESLIVESEWDYTTYASFPTEKDKENAISVLDKVGLLSIYDYMMTGGTSRSSTSRTFLNNNSFWWTTSPKISASKVWCIDAPDYADFYSTISMGGVRASVILKSDITLTGEGNGEIKTPYMLEGDTKVGQVNELLSSRISGEYIKFNNVKYRIVDIENGLTKITMADYSVNRNTLSTSVAFGASTSEITFSTTYGIGKYLDDWYNATSESDTSGTYTGLYLSETAKAMIATPSDGVRWYAGPDEGTGYDYIKAPQGTAIVATIGLGRYGEMFSTNFDKSSNSATYTCLITKYSGTAAYVFYNSGYAIGFNPINSRGARPSMYLKSNIKITGGSGMPHDPYEISQ